MTKRCKDLSHLKYPGTMRCKTCEKIRKMKKRAETRAAVSSPVRGRPLRLEQYEGKPCAKCGGTRRYFGGQCAACQRARSRLRVERETLLRQSYGIPSEFLSWVLSKPPGDLHVSEHETSAIA